MDKREIRERAFAKINLTMDITGRLDNGYHAVRTVMQSVEFGDELVITPHESVTRAQSRLRYLPTGEKNVAVRALRLFREKTGLGPENAIIRIDKRIPVCGGLGGSSTDGAAVLRALNRAYGAGLDAAALERMSEALGSDTAFCVAGGTVLAEGRGEKLTHLEPGLRCAVLICRPDFSSSTPQLFAALDVHPPRAHPDTAGMLEALRARDLTGVARRLYNVFEEVLPPSQADMVARLKGRLLDSGALGASMSGSGSAVFGLFSTMERAGAAAHRLRAQGVTCYLTRTTGRKRIESGRAGD